MQEGQAVWVQPRVTPRSAIGLGRRMEKEEPPRVIGGVIRGFRRGHQDLEMSLVEFWIFLDPFFRINLEMMGW